MPNTEFSNIFAAVKRFSYKTGRNESARKLQVMRKFFVMVAKRYVIAMTKALPYPYINTPHNM